MKFSRHLGAMRSVCPGGVDGDEEYYPCCNPSLAIAVYDSNVLKLIFMC